MDVKQAHPNIADEAIALAITTGTGSKSSTYIKIGRYQTTKEKIEGIDDVAAMRIACNFRGGITDTAFNVSISRYKTVKQKNL